MDLEHQWGDPQSLQYAVLYRTGVYLDLTLTATPKRENDPDPVLWQTGRTGQAARSAKSAAMPIIRPDPLEDTIRMFWLGSVLCARYLARGDLFSAVWFMESRRSLFVRGWRLAYCPLHADWGLSRIREDMPGAVLERLARSVTAMDRESLSGALQVLMALMEEHGPGMAMRCGVVYPEEGAKVAGNLARATL